MWGWKIENDGTQVKVAPVYGLFCFRLLDGDYYYRYEKSEFEKHVLDGQIWEEKKGGRTRQTRDKFDIEDQVHIARELLIPIDKKFKSGVMHGRRSRNFCEYWKVKYEIKS